MSFPPVSSLHRIVFVLAALSLAVAAAARAGTINVPRDQPTIQAGINAAATGDTVLIAPGTYYENIDFKGKAITVSSSGGAAVTILDGGSKGPAVTFQTNETPAAVLSKLTIQNGGNYEGYGAPYVSAAGGILVYQSRPTLLNNVLTHNLCWTIYVAQGGPLIQGNDISATQDPKGQCSFGGNAAIYIGGN